MTCYQLTPRGDSLFTLWRHLPVGVAWIAFRMPGKVAYRLFQGFAAAYEAMSAALCRAHAELDPRQTTDLISEWEAAVGLPDACLPAAIDIAERRRWVMWRLAKRRWMRAADWHDLAALFGLQIVITPGWLVQKPALYAATYPKRYDLFPKLGRFHVFINIIGLDAGGYDYGSPDRGEGYPVPYGDTSPSFAGFQCLIERVKPANVVIVWNFPLEHPAYGFCISESFSSDFSTEFC